MATNIDVGPSAAPIIPIDAASFKSNPSNTAKAKVKNIPNCAAAPNKSILGFESSGPKSIIAPIPINKRSGNNSFAIPALNKTSYLGIYLRFGAVSIRSIVAKAIETEIAEGRGFGKGLDAYVVADVRHLPKEVILEKLHGIRELAITFEHADPLTQPIPIRPTCHYSMGGIDVVDYKSCGTVVPGLFAAGEAACVSVHGANRLGGNSLADAVVFGKVAGEGAVAYVAEHSQADAKQALDDAAKYWENRFTEVTSRKDGRPIAEIRDEMANAMWNKVGIFREAGKMQEALDTLNKLIEEYKTCFVGDTNRTFNMAFVNYVEVGSLLTVAKAAVMGAMRRKESRGSHLREDFPKRDDKNFLNHTLITLNANGEYEVGQRDVVVTRFEPKERTY